MRLFSWYLHNSDNDNPIVVLGHCYFEIRNYDISLYSTVT